MCVLLLIVCRAVQVQKDLPAAEGAFVRVLEEDPHDDDAKQALVELGREMAAGKS
jgi:hypothetical protein